MNGQLIGNAMYFLATSRKDIYYNVDEDPAFRFSTTLHMKPIDFVLLIENWPITNDDARKANWARLLSINFPLSVYTAPTHFLNNQLIVSLHNIKIYVFNVTYIIHKTLQYLKEIVDQK